jgi:DNA-binding response OmpR family regulator
MLRILWLDNDIKQTEPYVYELQRQGHDVSVVKKITDCENLLNAPANSSGYDLLILDVMIPTKTEAEEQQYDPDSTDRGNITGLAFWSKWQERLAASNTKVLVLTVRLDKAIKERFVQAGLPREAFSTKVQLREPEEFIKRIKQLTNESGVRN